MNSDRPNSNPEQACFALECSFDAYIAGVGAGQRPDLIRHQDGEDFRVMRNAKGAYRFWLNDLDTGLRIRGQRQRLLPPDQDAFEDWTRSTALRWNLDRDPYWGKTYESHATERAWLAWQARGVHTSSTELMK